MAIILIIPLWQRGKEGDFKNKMLSYNKQLKTRSQHLRKKMTDAENMLWLKLRRKQLKGYQFYPDKQKTTALAVDECAIVWSGCRPT